MGSANVTLYAMWTLTSSFAYTVTYNGNGNTGGSVPADPNTYTQGATVTVLGNTGNLVNTGYTFVGWNTQANGSGTTYTQGQTFAMAAASVTLYAMWTTSPTYTVTYNGNGNTGGSVPIDTTNYVQGQTVTVFGNTGNLVNTGYSFSSWNMAANGTGTSYTQGQTFPMGSANVTLYAMWTVTIAREIYVANNSIDTVSVFNSSLGGNVSPLRQFGSLTGMKLPIWRCCGHGK